MSSIEIPPDQIYEIDQETFDRIDKIVHDVKTRYATWYDFVDDAVRTFATWWDNPPDAFKMFTQVLWPHMTSKQHDIMKDPKFGGIKAYEKAKKEAEEYHKKNKLSLHPPEIEVDTVFQNNAIRKLEATGYLQYTIKARRVYDIEEILKTAKNVSGDNYYQSSHDFMKQTIHLFINYWSNPYGNVDVMCEMFPFLTKKQCRLWYNLDPSKDGSYMTFKKLAEDYHQKTGRKMIIDDGIEQLIEQKKNEEAAKLAVTKRHMTKDQIAEQLVIQDQPRERRTEDYVNVEVLLQQTKEIKKQIKNMNEKGVFKKPDDALLSDSYSLIRQFYNRFFPIKLTLTVLAGMIYHESSEPVDYNDFREEAFSYVVHYSTTLKEKEKKYENPDGTKGLDRTKKISTGLPLSRPPFPDNGSNEQKNEYTKLAMKWESSKERFLEQYIGPTTKQWQRKKKDQNSDDFFDGALNSMDLVSITEDSNGRLKINFTEKGAKFYDIANEILDNFPNIRLEKQRPISSKECVFLMENVIKKEPFYLEKKLVDTTYDILEKADDQCVFGSELDDSFKEVLREIAEKYDDPERKKKFLEGTRQATMGRLSEMGLVDWTIYSKENGKDTTKYGKSCFILNESLKDNW